MVFPAIFARPLNCMLKTVVFIPALLLLFCLFVQVTITHAIKVAGTPRVDGVLDEEVWLTAPSATSFITSTPSFGMRASDSHRSKSVVR